MHLFFGYFWFYQINYGFDKFLLGFGGETSWSDSWNAEETNGVVEEEESGSIGLGLELGSGSGSGSRSRSGNNRSIAACYKTNRSCGFTIFQIQELQLQSLIFKYMEAGLPVPSHLVLPIWKSVASSFNGLLAGGLHQLYPGIGKHTRFSNPIRFLKIMSESDYVIIIIFSFSSLICLFWWNVVLGSGGMNLEFRNGMDPEPGRCRRTDGKKWRCSKEAVPDHKYCERHLHRGRPRSRKLVEASSGSNTFKSSGSGDTNTNLSISLSAVNT